MSKHEHIEYICIYIYICIIYGTPSSKPKAAATTTALRGTSDAPLRERGSRLGDRCGSAAWAPVHLRFLAYWQFLGRVSSSTGASMTQPESPHPSGEKQQLCPHRATTTIRMTSSTPTQRHWRCKSISPIL